MVEFIDWHEWISRHGPTALLYALQITPSRADAEDAVHDGFIRFWSRRNSARNLPALFFTCVRSAAMDLRRGQSRRQRRQRTHLPDAPLLAASTSAPSDAEVREQVEQALRLLPEPQREVVVLKIWADLSFAEVAELLQESPNTIASRYRYAMQALEQTLSPEFEHGTR